MDLPHKFTRHKITDVTIDTIYILGSFRLVRFVYITVTMALRNHDLLSVILRPVNLWRV